MCSESLQASVQGVLAGAERRAERVWVGWSGIFRWWGGWRRWLMVGWALREDILWDGKLAAVFNVELSEELLVLG